MPKAFFYFVKVHKKYGCRKNILTMKKVEMRREVW